MDNTPLMTIGYPRAIVHIDADAFFASVEQALVPSLKGKPVVTGRERGIIACANYEAKAFGIKRGVELRIAKQMCPELIILPSDYESYGLYSRRMFNIMRRFTPVVEEYSVDEAFLDITGMRRMYRCSYEEIALKIKETIQQELDITVSVGLSLSKTLAKLCSKFRKPDGSTAVRGRHIHLLLQRTPLEKVWGFGPNTVSLLHKMGLRTAYDYVMRSERWASRLLNKPGRELWNELRGHSVWKVTTEEQPPKTTIIRSKTFTPPSRDVEFVFAKLIRNVEMAFAKLRRHRLRAKALGVVLRHQDFNHSGLEAKLNRSTGSTLEAIPLIRALFDRTFRQGCEYRSTLIALGRFEDDRTEQYELFEDRLKIEDVRRITEAVDAVNRTYGKHAVASGSCLFLDRKTTSSRDDLPSRRSMMVQGENAKQRLAFPRLDLRV